MPICHKLKFIFIHVPKCAGTSISEALTAAGADLEYNGRATARQREIFRQVWLHHIPAEIMYHHLSPEIWRSYYKFSFVRNPWDWLVSVYHRHGARRTRPANEEGDYVPTAAEVEQFQSWAGAVCARDFAKKRGATYYLTGKNNDSLMDFVGKYESIGQDFDHICRTIGISVPLAHTNASRRGGYRHYYTPSLAERVGDVLKDDVEAFGYDF